MFVYFFIDTNQMPPMKLKRTRLIDVTPLTDFQSTTQKGHQPDGQPTNDRRKPDTWEKQNEDIIRAKDQGQTTLNASMTAVHISILRNVLQDDGKENEFLKWFVISVFSVQIIVGLVSLYVGLLRKYYRKHGQDFATECWYLLPCFKCRKPQSPSKNENEETRSMSHSTPLKSTCCPLECVSVNLPYDDFELKTLSMYDDLKAKLFSSHKGQEEMAPLLNKEKNSLLHKQVEELEHIVEHIESERLMKRITFLQFILNVMFYIIFAMNLVISIFMGNAV